MATHRLLKLVRDLSSAHSAQEVLEQSVDAAMEVSGTDSGWVWLEEKATGIWEPACRRGLWSTYPEDGPARFVNSLQTYLIAKPDLDYIYHESKGLEFNDGMRQSGATTWGAVPLRRDGLTIGCMVVSSRTKGSISRTDEQVLQIIAWQMGFAQARVRAEEEMRGHERAHRIALDAQTELQCQYLPDGTLIFVNEAYCRFFGRMSEDLIGTSFFAGLDEEDRKLAAKRLAQLVPAGREDVLEVQAVVASGDLRWVRWSRRGIFDHNGKAIKFLSTGSDITEKVTILRALEDTERRYRTLVETARDVIFTLDMDFKFTYVSPSVTSVLGYHTSELDSLCVLDTFTDSSRKRLLEVYGNMLAAERKNRGQSFSRTEQIQQYHKAGHTVWTEATVTFLRDRDGRPKGILMISRDVTERRHIEQMKSDFVTSAAHHLRTPLTSILGFSELLLIKDDLTAQERAKYLEYIRQNSQSMSAIIDDLLDIARIESGEGMPLRPQVLDLLEIVEETAAFYRESSSVHRIEVSPATGPIEVFADKYRITRLFRNLFDNAFRYSPAGGLIRVTCESFPEHHLFGISDEGVGMNPKQTKRVFDPFYRVDASDTADSGTGLGLTVARNIVEALGGRIWLESEKDRGTKVKFTLPKRRPTDGK